MSLAVHCDACGRSQSVPDTLAGQAIVCGHCGHHLTVPGNAPLMPPPLPGADTGAGAAVPRAALPAAPPVKLRPTTAGSPPAPPPVTTGYPVAAPPPVAMPPPPPVTPPPRVVGRESLEFPSDTFQSAVTLRRMPIMPWVVAGILVTGVLIAVFVSLVSQRLAPNPPVDSISMYWRTKPNIEQFLGPRQSGIGYSFKLPANFTAIAPPPTQSFPEGTESYAWGAKPDTDAAGSVFKLWVIPRLLNIDQELQDLSNLDGMGEYKVTIHDKSSYGRLGDSMLAVRALLEGSNPAAVRKGILYIIADGRQTLMVIGLGKGPKVNDVQALFDHAARTIRKGSASDSAVAGPPAAPAPRPAGKVGDAPAP